MAHVLGPTLRGDGGISTWEDRMTTCQDPTSGRGRRRSRYEEKGGRGRE